MSIELRPLNARESLWEVDGSRHRGRSLPELVAYFADQSREIERLVNDGAGLYFKGFPVVDVHAFHQVISSINPNFVPYTGAKVRTEDANHLYRPTSTPGFRKNFLHNEMAYQRDIPSKIYLYCARPAPRGGESILGDQRDVYSSIPLAVRSEFESRRLMFVRKLVNDSAIHRFLTKHFDIMAIMPSWQGNFGVTERKLAEKFCTDAGFSVEWTSSGQMIIRCIIHPVLTHPVTGEPMWVNNAHLFQLHAGVYGPALYTLFKTASLFSRDTMTTCLYGDGNPIPPEAIQAILDATERNEVPLALQSGDFAYANNHCISHGRLPFSGSRELLFGLAS